MMKIESAGGTHIGNIRENNEDNFYINGFYKTDMGVPVDEIEVSEAKEQYVYAVCDGMGGEALGELASLIAVETLKKYDTLYLKEDLMQYVEEANGLVCNEIIKNDGKRIGTTVAMLLLKKEKALVCNIGDSRIYRYRNSMLEQLSVDHTRAQQMAAAGIISKDIAKTHKQKHVLTQHLGIFPEEFILEPYINSNITLQKDDMYLLCSDGLTDMLSDEDIAKIIKMNQYETPETIVCELMSESLNVGGRDNTTIIIVKIL